MKAPMKFCNYVYGVRSLVETSANTLVYQLNFPTNDLPEELVTCWIVWIQLFDFDVKEVPGRQNGGRDGIAPQL